MVTLNTWNDAARRRLVAHARKFGRQEDLAAAAGLPKPTLQKLLSGSAEPKISTLLAVTNALGVRLDAIMNGESVDLMVTSEGGATAGFEMIAVEAKPFGGQAETAGDAGGEVPDQVPFPEEWLRRHFGKVKGLKLITVVGNSMQPDLIDGDWVMIDPARQKGDGVYVITHNGVQQIKRLFFDVSGVTVRSISRQKDADGTERYREERFEHPADGVSYPFQIEGVVVWTGRKSWPY